MIAHEIIVVLVWVDHRFGILRPAVCGADASPFIVGLRLRRSAKEGATTSGAWLERGDDYDKTDQFILHVQTEKLHQPQLGCCSLVA